MEDVSVEFSSLASEVVTAWERQSKAIIPSRMIFTTLCYAVELDEETRRSRAQ